MTTQQTVWTRIASHICAAVPIAIEAQRIEEDFTLIQVVERVIATLDDPIPVFIWDSVRELRLLTYNPIAGLNYEDPAKSLPNWKPAGANAPELGRLMAAISYLGAAKGVSGLFVFLDAHKFLFNPGAVGLQRMVQILCQRFRMSGNVDSMEDPDFGHTRRLAFLGQDITVSPDLSRMIPKITVGLPTAAEIREEMKLQAAMYRQADPGFVVPAEDDEQTWLKLVRTAQGLTRKQIELAIAMAAADYGCLGMPTVEYLHSTKLDNLREVGIEICAPPKYPIGGLNELKCWIDQRIVLFNEAEEGDDVLKGVLVYGLPGTGKSLLAATFGEKLQAPVFRLEADAIYGSLVGQSEQNARRILTLIEAIAPAVLWIDELEKFFAQSETDSVGKKVLGIFLSWMQEKTSQVVVIATANDLSSLPPELTRKGRFDEIFFVDLPTKTERAEIAKIHLCKRGNAFLMATDGETEVSVHADTMADAIAFATEDFSGAEIAELVKAADLAARTRGEKGVLRMSDVLEEKQRTIPLAQQQADRIKLMRERAKTFRLASVEEAPQAESAGTRAVARRMKAVTK